MIARLRKLALMALAFVAIAAFIRVRTEASAPSSAAGTSDAQETTTVDRGDVQITVSSSGTIDTKQNISLSFATSGKVASISVNEGDHVRKGQTIAALDSQSALDAVLQAQAKVNVEQAALNSLTATPRQVDILVDEANLKLAQAELKSATNSVDRTQAKIDQLNVEVAKNQLWQAELDRDANTNQKADMLKDSRTAAQASSLPSNEQEDQTLTSKDYSVQIAQANLNATTSTGANVSSIASAHAAITSAQNQLNNLLNGGDPDEVAQAKASLDSATTALKDAQNTLDNTKLLAPFDGVIGQINLHVGQQTPSGAAVQFLDASTFYVDIPIDESDINKVALGQDVTLKFTALSGKLLNGKVTKIATSGTKSGDVVTYTVRVEVNPSTNPLLPSMSATVNIITGQVQNAIRIQNRFVRLDRTNNKAYANVQQKDGTFKEVEITLGLQNDTYSEVKSGLTIGNVLTLPSAQTTTTGGPGPGGA